jgi:L-lactate dehydrogenase complex protein LldE
MSEPAAGPAEGSEAIRVGLFVTCLVDFLRPSIGFAAVKLLEDAGCTVEVPLQSCCGQPAYNSGDRNTTRAIAQQVIEAFAPYDYVVVLRRHAQGALSRTVSGRSRLAPEGGSVRGKDV